MSQYKISHKIQHIQRINQIKFRTFIFTSIFFIFLCTCVNFASVNASTIEDELKSKIAEQGRNIELLNQEIKQYEELADKTSKEAQTLQKAIKQIENNIKLIETDVKKTRSKIDLTSLDIKRLDLNIQESEQKVSEIREIIAKSIQNIQHAESFNIVENLLGQRNLSEALVEINGQVSFNVALKSQIDQLKGIKQDLEINKTDKEEQKDELVKLQSELSDKKKVVVVAKNEQAQVLKETKNQEQTYQQIVKEKLAKKKAFEKELFEYESKLKYSSNPSALPTVGSTALSWPIDNVRISQRFGKTVAARRLYVSGSHSGVDFAMPVGTPVKAVQSGVVEGTGDTDLTCRGASLGRWVFIRHNNGLASAYAHLSVISATNGQTVAAGDVIGYSGNTGHSTGPHLHLTVYDASAASVKDRPSISCGGKVYTMPIAPTAAYLDPMLYLPTYTGK